MRFDPVKAGLQNLRLWHAGAEIYCFCSLPKQASAMRFLLVKPAAYPAGVICLFGLPWASG